MLPRPGCPRAGQSGLWQNWARGSIGDLSGARFGDHARRDARWARVFQELPPHHGSLGCYQMDVKVGGTFGAAGSGGAGSKMNFLGAGGSALTSKGLTKAVG